MRRSMLFLPGNTPSIIINGEILGADAVILDLEDAVSPTEKDSARVLVRNAISRMGFGGCEVIVRINATDTDYWKKDLDAIIPVRPAMIMPPKTGTAQDVLRVDEYISALEDRLGWPRNTVRLIPLIETALGVENAFAIASASPRVAAIFLGAEDLTADLRCPRTKEGTEIFYARSRMVSAARAAGVRKIVVTHPEWWIVDMSLEDQLKIVKDYDVYLERCFAQNMGGGKYKSNLPDNLEVIQTVGYKNVMISTDGGQVENPHWELAYEQYMQYMADHGVSEDELHYMTHTIQAGLLNLED